MLVDNNNKQINEEVKGKKIGIKHSLWLLHFEMQQ